MAIPCRWIALSLLVVTGCSTTTGPGSGSAVLSYSPGRTDMYHPVLTWQATDLPGTGAGGVGESKSGYDSTSSAPAFYTHRTTFYGKWFMNCSDCSSATVSDVIEDGEVIGHWNTATVTPQLSLGPVTIGFEEVTLLGGCYVIVAELKPNRPATDETLYFMSGCVSVPSLMMSPEEDDRIMEFKFDEEGEGK